MIEQMGSRLVQARKGLGMTQDAFSAHTGLPLSTLKKYEGSHTVPGADALALIAQAGINVHWLLTGCGEMFIDSPAVSPTPVVASATRVETRINVDALAAAFDGASKQAQPGQTQEQTLRHAVALYIFMFERGMITVDGVGKIDLPNVA